MGLDTLLIFLPCLILKEGRLKKFFSSIMDNLCLSFGLFFLFKLFHQFKDLIAINLPDYLLARLQELSFIIGILPEFDIGENVAEDKLKIFRQRLISAVEFA